MDNCNFQTNDFGILKVHMYDIHQIGTEARCEHCNKKFGNWRVYEKHLNICQTAKDKNCPVCQKAYKSMERLISHMDNLHKGTPQIICETCGGIFINEDSLRVHQANQHK